jgi:hypothetical protein
MRMRARIEHDDDAFAGGTRCDRRRARRGAFSDVAECDALLRHALDLVAPPEATEADRSKAIASTRDEWRARCRTMSRATYTCAISAATASDLVECDQPTRNSSTSNSSVAPGGMTPPAPRSP